MDISVIVPIYNVEKYIDKCLRSLFTQTKIEGVEFILINDSTPDDSMKVAQTIISEYPSINTQIVNMPVNFGSAVARMKGIELAEGKYTIQIDSDDWVEPTMLEELYNKAIECDADIVGCDYIVDTLNGSRYVSMPMGNDNIECLKMMLSTNLTQSLCFKMVKRDLYKQDGVAFYLAGVDTWEDFVASAKLFYYAKKVAYIPKAFYHYVQISSNSISRSGFSQKRLDNIIDAVNDVDLFLNNTPLKTNLERSIIDRKIYAKFSLVKSGGPKQKEYIRIYPEINSLILSQHGMPYHNRLALYCASMNLLAIFNFIMLVVRCAKRVRYKLS